MFIASEDVVDIAIKKLKKAGLKITFSKKNCKEENIFKSSSINLRIEDTHGAFYDKNVKAIFTVIGGFNSNQILKYIDYSLIKNNPKII